jgi:hypothetical protein
VKEYIRSSESIGIDLTFGFPNKKALPMQIRGGYEVVDIEITPWVMILDATQKMEDVFNGSLLGKAMGETINQLIKLLFIPTNNILFKGVSEADQDKLEAFSIQVSKENPDIIIQGKTWNYLDWRFNRNHYTNNKILTLRGERDKIQGILILGIEDRGKNRIGSIQDFSFTKDAAPAEIKKLFKGGIKWLYEEKAETIHLWQSTCFPFADRIPSLSKLGFVLKRKRFIKQMIIHSNINIDTRAENWYVTKAYKRY